MKLRHGNPRHYAGFGIGEHLSHFRLGHVESRMERGSALFLQPRRRINPNNLNICCVPTAQRGLYPEPNLLTWTHQGNSTISPRSFKPSMTPLCFEPHAEGITVPRVRNVPLELVAVRRAVFVIEVAVAMHGHRPIGVWALPVSNGGGDSEGQHRANRPGQSDDDPQGTPKDFATYKLLQFQISPIESSIK